MSLSDDFNRADNDELHGQTAPGGPTWARMEGTFSNARMDVLSNLVIVIGNNVICSYRLEEDASGADHSNAADISSPHVNNQQGVICRCSSSAATYCLARTVRGSDQILLQDVTTGTPSTLATISSAGLLNDGTIQRLRLEANG